MVENRSVVEQTHEVINFEHALTDAEMKLLEKFAGHVHSGIKKEHRNQTHMVDHQPRANLIVEKRKVNKVNSNSEVNNKGKATNNMKSKANKHAGIMDRFDTGPSFVLIKGSKLSRQLAVNMVVAGSSGASTLGATERYVSVQLELLTIYEPCDWLIDTGANVQICADKSLFIFYQAISGRMVSMGNSSTAEVLGIGSVDLKFPSRGFEYAYHILNGVPLKHNTSTPFKLWKGKKPSLKYFRVWGCLAKVLVLEHKRKKLGLKTVDVVFLSYVETSYALRFLGIPSSVSLDDSLASTSIPEHVEKMSNVRVNPSSTSLTYDKSNEIRWSKRARVVKDFGSDFVTYNIEDDPVTFTDVIASSKASKEAVKIEMDFIVSNGTWVLVDLSLGCTTIGCKCIFKKKLKPDGSFDKFKARLVTKDLNKRMESTISIPILQ
ncbi:hypothetical protein Sango_2721800 [Sesamum angolense]|uniref:Retrovirus-related Pol polyprotein from transposon TNT 1-94-like beta-barrel domain-containing protein n=1 Tax=Sesamum angolense TaxID=2727404 RepID=A0AAE1T9Z2_9LAMI|nr:hypothetical protein Sango_2721800 [Sesamum angolense]